ncbi:MAG: hypothetical protein J7603_26960, partial [Pseudacidovorax sp.]|nr:hypothetical protein [Pseudacidovorax sp.]
ELLSERAYEAPQGEAEQALAAIWSQVLGVERIGRHDNFFELGGHSLLAARLVARVHQVLPGDFTIRDVFLGPTLAAQATGLSGSAQQQSTRQALSEIDALIDRMEAV